MKLNRIAAVVVAALVAGLCFAPVFGVVALVVPLALLGLVVVGVCEACRRWPKLLPWRPLLVLLAGLLAVAETVLFASTVAGVPTAETVRLLGAGLESWRVTLESTWPARPDPQLILFVPLLVLAACLLGVELLDRGRPLVAVLPSLGVLVVSQLYAAVSGWSAVLAAVGYGAAVAALLASGRGRSAAGQKGPAAGQNRLAAPAAVALLVVTSLAGGFLLGVLDPTGRTPYTVQGVQSAELPAPRISNPLGEIAERLEEPDTVQFRYRSQVPVSRWRLVALEDFDGASWKPSGPFLRLGTELGPGPEIKVSTTTESADVQLDGLTGPWLPSQLLPMAVHGSDGDMAPQVEPGSGTLLAADRPDRYRLTWSRPVVDAATLKTAGLDSDARGGLGDIGAAPTDVATLADEALAGRRPTFQTALALERFFATYRLATPGDLPTGHSWPQLHRFLVTDKVGTSEQFAAAYVMLARLNGIPARLAVGFRAPDGPDLDGWTTVHNSDVLAWPEVAVEGVGWWPLDPAGQAQRNKPVVRGSDSELTEELRSQLPPSKELEDPQLPIDDPGAEAAGSSAGLPSVSLGPILAAPVALLVAWLVGVPLLKWARAARRRRRTGTAAVVGAWAEARDRLRAHGVTVTAGMTIRDLGPASGEVANEQVRRGLSTVARAVDTALWSGVAPKDAVTREAWAGVHALRVGLRRRSLADRIQAALELRSLVPPRRQP